LTNRFNGHNFLQVLNDKAENRVVNGHRTNVSCLTAANIGIFDELAQTDQKGGHMTKMEVFNIQKDGPSPY